MFREKKGLEFYFYMVPLLLHVSDIFVNVNHTAEVSNERAYELRCLCRLLKDIGHFTYEF